MELTREAARLFYEELEPYGNLEDSLEQAFAFADLPEDGALLDVACGAGHWLGYVMERKPSLRVFGLDFSPKAANRVKTNAPGASMVCADILAAPFSDNAFNVLTCFGSLEHFYDPGGALKQMARLANRLVAFVPLDVSSEADQPVFFVGDLPAWKNLFEGAGWNVSRTAPMEVWRGNIFLMEGTKMIDTVSWDISKDFAEFSGIPEDEVREKAARGVELAAKAWNSLPAGPFHRKAERFYQEMDEVYIYDHLLAHLNHPFTREWYRRHLEPKIEGKAILDFGAGIGVFAIQMAMDGADVTYYDLPGIHRDFAVWRLGHVELHLGAIKGSLRFADTARDPDEPFDRLYDVVFSYATLEHLYDAELSRALKAMDSCLAAGGLMIHFVDPHADRGHPMHRPRIIRAVRSLVGRKGYEVLAKPAAPAPGVWRKKPR